MAAIVKMNADSAAQVQASQAANRVKGLKAFSDECETHASGEEIQTLQLDDRYFVSTNQLLQSQNLFARKGDVASVFGTSASRVLRAESPKVASEKHEDNFKVVILEGQAPSATKLHAEQNLLLVLAWRLRAGKVPKGFLGVAGNKVPCLYCRQTLTAFSAALKATYDVDLFYNPAMQNPDGTAAKGAVTGLTRLSLSDVPMTGMPPADPKYALFVTAYNTGLPAH
jgi:hypothetical protein